MPKPRTPSRRCLRERDELVAKWLHLARHVARHSRVRPCDLDDAEQNAQLGVIRAAELWDETRGIAFSTYATWAARNAMLHGSGYDSPIHVPSHARRRATKFRAAVDRAFACSALSASAADDLQGREQDPAVMVEVKELAARLQCLLEVLPIRERLILRLRFWEHRTLQEVGERLGITKERVRQLESCTLRWLRELLSASAAG